ncbi:LysR family transcriptional regulator [Gordonia sp. DT219]|uniref:LysR family transcriptional regulator n=1 Tax=Gordonia sp. DT219 TaxID=3416658 RepID=UPI003CF7F3B3
MNRMELRDLEYVLAVTEERSFTRAATRLGIAQPPLSRAIARLERRLAVTLFDRTSRAVTPTAAGRALATDARVILDASHAAVDRVRAANADRPLTLAVRPATGSALLDELLHRVTTLSHPIPVQVQLTRTPTDAVRTGTADAALACLTNLPGGLVAEELRELSAVALVARTHPLGDRETLMLREVISTPGYLAECPDLGLDEIVDHIHLHHASVLAAHDIEPRLGGRVRAVPVVDAPAIHLGLAHHPGRVHPRMRELLTQARRAAYPT